MKLLVSALTLFATLPAAAFSFFGANYTESHAGYTVRIEALVNGAPKPGPHVIVEAHDAVELVAKFYHRGKKLTDEEVRERFDLDLGWYKILSDSNAYLDPAAINHFSEGAQFSMRNLTPFIPSKLAYSESQFTFETEGRISPDFKQPNARPYAEAHGEEEVGTIRWKVYADLVPKDGGDTLHIVSPDEKRINKPFDKLDYAKAKEVFLLARRGGTGFKAFDNALSYLGLPYIWWTGPIGSRLGLTCSQFVGYSAFGRNMNTAELKDRKGIRVVDFTPEGKFIGLVDGKKTELEYGKHVQPGAIIVYHDGLEDRHAGMIGDDLGTQTGFLDLEDKMLHSAIGGILGGNFFKVGIEYTNVGKLFNADALAFNMKIVPAE